MMERDYRREMDQVTLSPQQKERIIQAMGREQTRRRAVTLRLLLAAALLCAALTTSALALSPTLRDHLAQLLGSFAPYSQRVEEAAAVCQEVEVRVVSAVTDQYRMKIYVEVTDRTGERFTDDSIRLSWDIPQVWDGLGIFSLILVLPAAARHVRDVKFKWSPLFCLPIGYISLILLYIFIFRPLAWRADYYPNRMASQILTCWWGWLP